MDATNINSTVLRKLLILSEKKEALLNKITRIEQEISAVTRGHTFTPGSSTTEKGFKTRRGRSRRGALKGRIIAMLTAAGESGVRVKDIANQLKIAPQNIHVWFSSTGKKLGVFKKVSPGHYRISGSRAASVSQVHGTKKRGRPAKHS